MKEKYLLSFLLLGCLSLSSCGLNEQEDNEFPGGPIIPDIPGFNPDIPGGGEVIPNPGPDIPNPDIPGGGEVNPNPDPDIPGGGEVNPNKPMVEHRGETFTLNSISYEVIGERLVSVYDYDHSYKTLSIPEQVTYLDELYTVSSINFDSKNYEDFDNIYQIDYLELPKSMKMIKNLNVDPSIVSYRGSLSDWCGVQILNINSPIFTCERFNFIQDNQEVNLFDINTIKIDDGITRINDYAFNFRKDKPFASTNIENIYLPKTIKYIGNDLFAYVETKLDIYYDGTIDDWLEIDYYGNNINGCGMYLKDMKGEYYLPTNITIPDGTVEIKANQFNNFTSLTSVTLPDSIYQIGDFAFQFCSNLVNINFPSHLMSIGSYAFSSSGLREVVLPDSLMMLGEGSFAFSWDLETITLPKTIHTIPNNAFFYCQKLSNFDFTNISTIGYRAFERSGLRNVILSNQIDYIGEKAFATCDYLQKFYLPSSIRRIGATIFVDEDAYSSLFDPNNIELYYDFDTFALSGVDVHKTAFDKINNKYSKYDFEFIDGIPCLKEGVL